MKIVVFSDTHLGRVTEELERLCERYCTNADYVVHLGDWTSSAVLSFMEQYPLVGVSGNMDDAVVRMQLPSKRTVKMGKFRVGMTHGYGYSGDLLSALAREFQDADVILFGHTHRPVVEWRGERLFLNPGSLFSHRSGDGPSLGILHVDTTVRGEIVKV